VVRISPVAMIFLPNDSQSAGPLAGAAAMQKKVLCEVSDQVRHFYSKCSIEDGSPFLVMLRDACPVFAMPFSFGSTEENDAHTREFVRELAQLNGCNQVAAIYPARADETVSPTLDCEPCEGVLVVAHARNQPDVVTFIPTFGPVGSADRFGEASECGQGNLDLRFRELLSDPSAN
jgi:hypothetical protein